MRGASVYQPQHAPCPEAYMHDQHKQAIACKFRASGYSKPIYMYHVHQRITESTIIN